MPTAFDTAINVINDAAIECGLASTTDVFGSTDPNFIQFKTLLKSSGRWLRRYRQWNHLRWTYTLNTSANVGRYAFPVDYGRMIDQTAWNRTNRLPMGGPVSPQMWQYLKARLVGVTFNVLFEQFQNQLQLFPDTTTPANYVLGYEYISNWWVTPNGTQANSGSWNSSTTYANATYIANGGRIYLSKAQPAWQGNTAYAVGNAVTNGGNVYLCTKAGTSAAAGGPSGTGTGIADGTCTWNFSVASGSGVSGMYGPIGLGQSFSKPAWQQSTAYSVGNAVTANSNIYICTVAGTSSNAGTGPSGTGLNITDGTVTWNFSTTSALSGASAFADGTCLWDFIGVAGADTAASNNDTILFDPQLMTRYLKLQWLSLHNFDTTAAQDDFQETLAQCISDDQPADVLRLDRGYADQPLLGERNLPITGIGS